MREKQGRAVGRKIDPQPDGACLRLGDACEQQGANSEGMAHCAHGTPAG